MGFLDRLQHAWNAFTKYNEDVYPSRLIDYKRLGTNSYENPGRIVLKRGSERTILGAVYNKIAIDCSSITFNHVLLDEQNRYKETVDSGLNTCLTLESNKDQTARMFIRDVVLSMFDEGCVAIAPIERSSEPKFNNAFDIYSMRVCKITQWYPDHVMLEAYNDQTGEKQQLLFPKKEVAIIENPLYAIMNERNSVAERLIHKLALLDAIDNQTGSGKLDLVVQLPYTIKTETKKQYAIDRRQDIEDQLNNSKYGIAYIDGTEKITQLNRPVENNLLKTVETFTRMLYDQLGVTSEIMNGTADEKTMLNYMNRTVRPILDAICDEIKRKFLSNAARKEGQTIMYFNDPFRLVPISSLADIADKFTRNEIMSSNELRQIIGLKPVNDPKADELRNKNINVGEEQTFANTTDENNSEQEVRITAQTPMSELFSDKDNQ